MKPSKPSLVANKSIKAFFLSLFFILSIEAKILEAKTIERGLFVFRSGNSVYSLSDMETYSAYLKDLGCFYPESLAYAYFKRLGETPKGFFNVETYKRKNETPAFKRSTAGFIGLVKMARYASSQSVSVNSELLRALRLSAKKNGCSLDGFSGDASGGASGSLETRGLKEEMMNLVLLEVFFRSRFAPGSSSDLSSKQRSSILKNIRSLEDSVNNQINHDLFEN